MYIKSFVVTEEHHTVEIPKEFYGQNVEVEIKKKEENNTISVSKIAKDSYYKIKNFDREAALKDLRINKYSLPSDYKFDREEANER